MNSLGTLRSGPKAEETLGAHARFKRFYRNWLLMNGGVIKKKKNGQQNRKKKPKVHGSNPHHRGHHEDADDTTAEGQHRVTRTVFTGANGEQTNDNAPGLLRELPGYIDD